MVNSPLDDCKDFASRVLNKKRSFVDKDNPIGSIGDPFEAERICQELKARINKMRYIDRNLLVGGEIFKQSAYPDQRGTSLCGPAAFWYCVLKDNPRLYQQAALQLWGDGKTQLRKLKISPGRHNRHPRNIYKQDSISGLDWMMLGGLRDSENLFFQPYDGGKNIGGFHEGLGGLTQAGTLESWFKKAGSKIIHSDYALYGLDLNHPDLSLIEKFNQYAGKSNYHVVTVIGSGMLKRVRKSAPEKNHWIVWESPVTVKNEGVISENSYNEIVQLKAFSWGNVDNNALHSDLTLKEFISYIFGGFIATKIP